MVPRRCHGEPDRHAHPVLLDAAASESGHVQHGTGHRGGALAIGLLVTLPWRSKEKCGPHEFGETRYYAPVPFMVWAAIRFRMYGATAAVALLSIFAVDAASIARAHSPTSRLRKHRAGCSISCCCAPRRCTWRRCSSSSGRVNDSLRESEERFRIIADQAPMMMWTSDARGGLRIRQPALAGLHRHDARTEPGPGLGKVPASRRHPEDLSTIYLRHFNARIPVEMEYRARRHDGEYRWVQVHGMPRSRRQREFTGYIGSAFDITDRRQHEAALQRSEALYRDVVDSQVAFVCRFLPDATLTFVNSAYCRSSGGRAASC